MQVKYLEVGTQLFAVVYAPHTENTLAVDR